MSKNLFSLIISDIKAAISRDPAARSYLEIILTYPGFHAVFGYRVSHVLWNLKLKLIARFISNIFRIAKTVAKYVLELCFTIQIVIDFHFFSHVLKCSLFDT